MPKKTRRPKRNLVPSIDVATFRPTAISAQEAFEQGTRPWVLYSAARFNERMMKRNRRGDKDQARINTISAKMLFAAADELRKLWRKHDAANDNGKKKRKRKAA